MALGKKWVDIFESQEIKPLDSELDIEEILLMIQKMDADVDFLIRLKQKRVKDVEDQIYKVNQKRELLENIIKATLESTGNKSLKFPGVAKVSLRERKGKWVITDEEKMLTSLKTILSAEKYNTIVVSNQSVVKSALNEELEQLAGLGTLPDGVRKEDDKVFLAIGDDKTANISTPANKELTAEEYDSLEF